MGHTFVNEKYEVGPAAAYNCIQLYAAAGPTSYLQLLLISNSNHG